ncbi:MAG: UTRA domain-containing protein [Chitinivibrionales bacterium]|nr:UTRA domain-containing protein [Chitinivibrionales bacterium]MBD3394792.1 UTRA domain-containing protein [Chitinivibrionales bacterium]
MQKVPKYYKISTEIISSIRDGALKPGMRVPSENEIIKEYKVSNTTARKILQQIENAGWVTRVKGKGTFVRRANVERSVNKILGFTQNMQEAGYQPRTKLLDAREVFEGYGARLNGREYSMTGPVFKIHRLRFADSIPMMVEVRYIALSLCPDIKDFDFTASLYDMYEQEYGHQLTEINQVLSTTMIDSALGNFFDIRDPIPAFRVESATFCGKGMILEMEDSIYRGDKYRFSVRALPERSNAS